MSNALRIPLDMLAQPAPRPLHPPNVIPKVKARVHWHHPDYIGSAFYLRLLDNGVCMADIPGHPMSNGGTFVWRSVFRAELSLVASGYVRIAMTKRTPGSRKALDAAFGKSVAGSAGQARRNPALPTE